MKILLLLASALIIFTSCNNSGKSAKTFCDTNCNTNEVSFKGDGGFNQSAVLKLNQCLADTLTWFHDRAWNTRQVHVSNFLKKSIRVNPSAIKCYFQDTTMVWFSFNDCMTGRGYLLKLFYSKNDYIQSISGALNSFDPKFSVDNDLRAYTDRGNFYVDNVTNGKRAQMTFKKEYEMDFDNIHKYIDTVDVTKQRMYIVLIDKNGEKIPFEKKIDL